MKKTVKTIISVLLTAMLTLSLASCSIFDAMRENALLAQQFVPENTPEEDALKGLFNSWLENSKTSSNTIKESISYSIGDPDIFVAGETNAEGEKVEAGILDAAAKQLKNFIKTGNPGSVEFLVKGTPENEDVKTKDIDDTLLFAVDEGFTTDVIYSRNETEVAVTDEDEKEVTNEKGEVVKEKKNTDNILHLTFNCYENTNLEGEEYATNENGEAAESTTFIYKDAAEIEEVFGSPLDKAEVIKNFENVEDYIKVLDYEIEYTTCKISADADLLANVLNFVNFQKEMKITATAECVGALEGYGTVEIEFTLTQSTYYEFTYEEAVLETSASVDTAEDDTSDSATEATVTEESSDDDESVDAQTTDSTAEALSTENLVTDTIETTE